MDYSSRNQYSLLPNDLFISSPHHPHSYSSGIIGEQSPTSVAGDGRFFVKLLKEGGVGGFGSFPDNGKPGRMRPPQDWDPAFGLSNGVLNRDCIDRGGRVSHFTLDPRLPSTLLDARGGLGRAHPLTPLFPSVEAFQVPSTRPLAFLPSQGAFPCARETSEGPWPFLDCDLRQIRADQWTQSAGSPDFHPPEEANSMGPPHRDHYPVRLPNLGYCPVEANSFALGIHNHVLPPPPAWLSPPSSSNTEKEKGHGRSSQDLEFYFATRQAAMHAIEKPLSTQEGGSMPKLTVSSAFSTVPNQKRSENLGVANPFPSDRSFEISKGSEGSKDTEEDELLKEVMMNSLRDLDISETPTDPLLKLKEDLRKGRPAQTWQSRQNRTTISSLIGDYHGGKGNMPAQDERGMSLQLGHPERNSEQSQQQFWYADSNGQGVVKEGGMQEAFSAISDDIDENGREESKGTALKTWILHSKKHPHADQRQGMIGRPVGGLFRMDVSHLEKLTMPLLCLFEALIPHEDVKKKRQVLLSCLGKIIAQDFPGGQLFLFGSCANDFGVSNSDIDICLAIGDESSNKAELVTKLARILEANRMQNLQALTHARVPIVKFTDPTTGISCDICINNMLAVVNTRLLHDYAQIDDRLRQLAFVVKHWAKCRNVNETYRGTLSSYAYVLMCIHFLQQRKPPILPCLQEMKPTYKVTIGKCECAYYDRVDKLKEFGSKNKESLGELLASFFEYWGFQHDYTRTVISIRTGGFLSKIEKEWTRRIGNERHLICIEDPFETSHDLGRVVDKHSIRFLRDEFQRAARILRHDPNPCVTLFFDP